MIRIIRGGLLTTVQDLGRRGMQQHGVSRGGAMDTIAHRIANLLVGNPEEDATLECTLLGPTVELGEETVFAIAGGDLRATLDDRPVPLWTPVLASAGSVLSFGSPRAGCRAYIAVAGGIDVPRVLHSRATDLVAGIGGCGGRAVASGDELAIGAWSERARQARDHLAASPGSARSAGRSLRPRYGSMPAVRVVHGPEHERFSGVSRELLKAGVFEVTPQSNRMGLRLIGPALSLAGLYDLTSSPVAMGTIQVPPSGEPIVLMADHQTIGGYPRIASVISVDLPLLAQAAPGTRIRFSEVSVAAAQALYLAREHDLRVFTEALRIHHST